MDDRRFLPHPPLAALRLRRGQCDEGRGARPRRGHRRPWHGQPRRRAPAPRHRQAGRGRGQADCAPLLGVEGHSRAAQGASGLLRAPLQCRARPRQRSHRHARQQGRPRQPRASDHRAGRRRADPQPELPDPSLRLHHRRGQHPVDPRRPRPRLLRPARKSDALHRAAAQGAGDRLSVEPDRGDGRPRLLRTACRVCARGQAVDHLRPGLCRNLLRRHADPVDPAGRPAPRTSRSSSRRCRKPIRWPGGGSASRSAMPS